MLLNSKYLLILSLIALSIVIWVLKTWTVIVDLSISPFSSINFAFTCFSILLSAANTHLELLYLLCGLLTLYHYISDICPSISSNNLCSEIQFIWYECSLFWFPLIHDKSYMIKLFPFIYFNPACIVIYEVSILKTAYSWSITLYKGRHTKVRSCVLWFLFICIYILPFPQYFNKTCRKNMFRGTIINIGRISGPKKRWT